MNLEVVKDYYGKVLKSSEDLKTSACCDGGSVPAELEPLLANVHEEVRSKYYGCGIVVPAALQGARVLDLGSGSGRDVYLMSQLVGPKGEVVGVDMTDEQLATAKTHIDWHMKRFGYERPNVRFLKGYIEKLGELGLEPAKLRRGRVELRDQSLGRQARRAQRRLRSAQAWRRALFRRRLLRPPSLRRGARRSGALWRVPGRGALLERLSPDGEARGLSRSAPRDQPAARDQE